MSADPNASVRVAAPIVEGSEEGGWRLSAEVDGVPVWFESDRPLSVAGEVWVAAFLIPAMRTGRPLQVDSPVDGVFLDRMRDVQELVSRWWGFPQIAITPASVSSEPGTADGYGLFFSGGVDSLYSLVENRERLTDLIFVHGFDIPLEDVDRHDGAWAQVRRVAEGSGLGAVHVTTNLRTHPLFKSGRWRFDYGGALAAVGHALSGGLSAAILSSGSVGGRPAGNHPDLDPLWASGRMEFVHFGNEVRRITKTAVIARDDVSMRNLRVCWENLTEDLNCGRCEKCLRTILHLEVAGARERASTFPDMDLAAAIRALPGIRANHRIYWEQAMDAIADPETRTAIRRKLSARYPSRRTEAVRAIRRVLRRVPVLWRLVG